MGVEKAHNVLRFQQLIWTLDLFINKSNATKYLSSTVSNIPHWLTVEAAESIYQKNGFNSVKRRQAEEVGVFQKLERV